MTQKTILITGCSSGIGYAAAVGLRTAGWRVFAACRRIEDCERLRDEGFDSPLIDYEDSDTIAAGLTEVLATTGRHPGCAVQQTAHTVYRARSKTCPRTRCALFSRRISLAGTN